MLDPMVSLAFSIYSGKGVYAALLGSGVSRSSGIPTGWEITQELVKKLATLSDAPKEDTLDWYRTSFKQEPDYSVLLEQIAKMTGDRHFTLRPYFEPTPEELEDGKKVPTAAHKAIADLVLKGYIRVIVTTNFDRLMEQALSGVGVTPNVVANADQVKGMVPLVHSRCTIIKVHGDYTDIRIKNTLGELATYEKEMNRLLDQVFDEYGLIVCGWSADWDEALRAAIERCPNRRFTTYWSAYSGVSGKAEAICVQREAQVIRGMGADAFFGQLNEKVDSLRAMDASRHPLSKQLAVASVKKYISEERFRPQLHDLFMSEAERLSAILLGQKYPRQFQYKNVQEIAVRIPSYETDADTLLAMMIAGGFWGSDAKLWVRCLERVAAASELADGDQNLFNLALYPVRLLLFGCGVAAAAANRDDTVAALLTQGRSSERGNSMGLWYRIGDESQVQLLENVIGNGLNGGTSRAIPISNRIYQRLLPEFRDYVSNDREFRAAFDRFEYLAGLIYADQEQQKNPSTSNYVWGPFGLFTRWGFASLADGFQKEIDRQGADLPLLKAGAFGNSLDRLQSIKKLFDEMIKGHAQAMGYH